MFAIPSHGLCMALFYPHYYHSSMDHQSSTAMAPLESLGILWLQATLRAWRLPRNSLYCSLPQGPAPQVKDGQGTLKPCFWAGSYIYRVRHSYKLVCKPHELYSYCSDILHKPYLFHQVIRQLSYPRGLILYGLNSWNHIKWCSYPTNRIWLMFVGLVSPVISGMTRKNTIIN
jgi:hypothetical protein